MSLGVAKHINDLGQGIMGGRTKPWIFQYFWHKWSDSCIMYLFASIPQSHLKLLIFNTLIRWHVDVPVNEERNKCLNGMCFLIVKVPYKSLYICTIRIQLMGFVMYSNRFYIWCIAFTAYEFVLLLMSYFCVSICLILLVRTIEFFQKTWVVIFSML